MNRWTIPQVAMAATNLDLNESCPGGLAEYLPLAAVGRFSIWIYYALAIGHVIRKID